MSDHLPECRYVVFQQQGQIPEAVIPMGCICPALRACEQRVTDEIWGAIREGSQYKSGFEGGLDAARDAIKASVLVWDATDDYTYGLRDAVAVIDALRGES